MSLIYLFKYNITYFSELNYNILKYYLFGGIGMHLNAEQTRITYGTPAGHSLLKGVAGCGKTTVAVNRIPFLLYNYCNDKDDNILMVTYNKTLKNYLKYLYNEVKRENKLDVLSDSEDNAYKVELINIDSLMYRYYSKYIKNYGLKYEILKNSAKSNEFFRESLEETKKLYSDVSIIDRENVRFLEDEVQWIKACNYLELDEYQKVDRLGRMSNKSDSTGQRLLKNSRAREAIFNLMLIYSNKIKENGFIDFNDIALIALKEVTENPTKKFTHIIIDEGQDLSRVQFQFLKAIYKEKDYSSILFIMDTAQSIYNKSWFVQGRSFTSIGFDMTGKSSSLAKNYRTTSQIAESAYSLIEKDFDIIGDENFVKPYLLDRQGEYPIYKSFNQSKSQWEFIEREINKNLKKNYRYKDIAIICRINNPLKELSKYLDNKNIPNNLVGTKEIDFDMDSIKLLTMHSAKGLEFKVVFIVELSENILPNMYSGSKSENDLYEIMEKKLLYVGMTRASEKLYMLSSGKPSKFIEDINSKFLSLKYNCSIRSFYDINVEEYIFKNKIKDVYCHEEKVRQWILKELNETYGYPIEIMDIEYKVNVFSQLGFVDAVIYKHIDNEKIPYIFIETKRPDKGLEEGIRQLKTYMSTHIECEYGIVTDGNKIIIFNKEQREIDDIPHFSNTILGTFIENYEYIDLKRGKNYEFARNGEKLSELIIYDNGHKEICDLSNLKVLNVYKDIAAGKPIYINSNVEDKFFLPNFWLENSLQCFMVKVRGDSMIDANINHGDYIVLKKQNTARVKDIVAVDINGEATLKRYVTIGDNIFLMPENKKYDPIWLNTEEANIIGVAIGIIKAKFI